MGFTIETYFVFGLSMCDGGFHVVGCSALEFRVQGSGV